MAEILHSNEQDRTRMQAEDFITGILGTLAQRRGNIKIALYDPRLHEAFSATSKHLSEISNEHGVDGQFSFILDIHGCSDTVSDTINTLHGIFRWRESCGDGGYITIPAISEEDYEVESSSLPGTDALYAELTDVFTDNYPS